MNHLVDAFDFQVDYYTNVKKLDSPEEKKKVMMYFIPFLRNVPAGIDRDNYIVKLSKATGYEIRAIREQINLAVPEETTGEETTYIDQIEFERLHPEKIVLKRLVKAEREALFYMLEDMGAVKYFEDHIDNFYYPLYQDIANYVVDYVEKRKEPVDVKSLLGDIASSGVDNADELEAKISEIVEDSYHPPYSEKTIGDCALAIKEEKDRAYDRESTEKALEGKSEAEKTKIIQAYSKRQAERLRARSKKNSA
jgi:DNA primase